MTTWEYTPGNTLAVVAGNVGVLVDLSADDPLLRELLACLADGPTLEDVAEVLLSQGLRRIVNFSAASLTADGVRVLVRGAHSATAPEHDPVHGSGLWTDHTFPGSTQVTLAADGDGGSSLPIVEGIVLAATLGLGLAPSDAGEQQQGLVVLPGRVLATEPRPLPEAIPAEPMPAPAEPAGSSASGPVPAAAVPEPAQPVATQPEQAQPVATQPEPAQPVATQPEPAQPVATQPEPAQPVAPQPVPEPVPPEPPLAESDWPWRHSEWPSGPVEDPPAPQVSAPVVVPPGPAGGLLIESFPWADDGVGAPVSRPAPAQEQVAASQAAPSPAEYDQEAIEMTVDRSRLIEHASASASSVLVVAARCPSGHLSPAYADGCRVCHQPLPPQQPTEVPRPPLGVLRLSNGDTVALDRGAILGRNPRLPAGYSGEQPNLVRLSDPGKDISSQHLEVTLDYWHVLVTDLGSTNGTEVILPGQAPIQLRPDDPMTIEPGTRVVLAGVFDFVFEVSG